MPGFRGTSMFLRIRVSEQAMTRQTNMPAVHAFRMISLPFRAEPVQGGSAAASGFGREGAA